MKPYRNSRDPEGNFALSTPQNPDIHKLPNLSVNALFEELQEVRRRAEAKAYRAAAEAPEKFAEPQILKPQHEPISAPETVIDSPPIVAAEPKPESEAESAPEPQPAPLAIEIPEVLAEVLPEVLEEVLAVPAKSEPPPTYRDPETFLERHARKCIICNHPLRDEIEFEFVHWSRPVGIARDYRLNDPRALHRHARATGLDKARRRNVRSALELIIEDADHVTVSADAVIRAVTVFTRITDRGEWLNPPTHVIMSSGNQLNVSIKNPTLQNQSQPAIDSQNGNPPIDVAGPVESLAIPGDLEPISNRQARD